MTSLVHELERRGGRYGLLTICIGHDHQAGVRATRGKNICLTHTRQRWRPLFFLS
ncbi:hypothetical protein [Geobacillus stearothermophilus]|uniref:hypothetical protein n=1 Tax=Geobacillus stearothermophilus TaxID=1422 RepID=UPI00399CBF64